VTIPSALSLSGPTGAASHPLKGIEFNILPALIYNIEWGAD
jgi:hypothetical protein